MIGLNVIFGTGLLAQATMRALLKRGKSIKMVNRSGKHPADVPADVEITGEDALRIRVTFPGGCKQIHPGF